jgi:hypothetical protein
VAGGELGVFRASKNGLSWVVMKCIPEYCLPRMFPFVALAIMNVVARTLHT